MSAARRAAHVAQLVAVALAVAVPLPALFWGLFTSSPAGPLVAAGVVLVVVALGAALVLAVAGAAVVRRVSPCFLRIVQALLTLLNPIERLSR